MPDESTWTPWGKGWTAPDNQSAEDQWRDFVGVWVALQRPAVVIETGAGSGTISKEIVANLPPGSTLTAFEGEPFWHDQAKAKLAGLALVPDHETPTADNIAHADLTILDSDPGLRAGEIERWGQHARKGAYCLIHDVTRRRREEDPDQPSCHEDFADCVDALGIAWIQTPNPRGGAILRHP